MENFDVTQVVDTVRAMQGGRADELHEKIARERAANEEAALDYARHLEAGGDPTKYADVPWSLDRDALLPRGAALSAVYVAWNEARGGTNPVSPVHNHTVWRIAEDLHQNVGRPVLFADLSRHGRGPTRAGASANDVMRALNQAQTETLVGRKVKVDGKVAYMLRERRSADEAKSHDWNVPEEKYAEAVA